MNKTYQTVLYKGFISHFELGWQVAGDIVIFKSNEHEDVSKAMQELNFHEPKENNWFATMIERIDGEVTDEEIFDSSVITLDD